VLSGIAQSAGKFSNDLRLLQNFKEMEEPFEKHQIGSSAMPYKRNPMRSERITSLSRYVMTTALNPALHGRHAVVRAHARRQRQPPHRVAEAFLGADAILNIYINVADGLVVYPKVINQRVMSELPFMATENIMMSAVKKGGDRQELHERIREHSLAAAKRVKEDGLDNDLISRIEADPAFGLGRGELDGVLEPINIRRTRSAAGHRIRGRRRKTNTRRQPQRPRREARSERLTKIRAPLSDGFIDNDWFIKYNKNCICRGARR
jgi:adenylosuccinate lyase